MQAAWDDAGRSRSLTRTRRGGARAALAQLRPIQLDDADGRHDLPDGVPAGDDVRAIVVTSGTTGEPKGVELTRGAWR